MDEVELTNKVAGDLDSVASSDAPEDASYRFGGYLLDTGAGLLLRHNNPVALKPKAYALLEYLVRNAGRLVSKDELLNVVWPRGFVCDAVLKVCVREIRQALDEQPDSPRYVQTVHRRGYRFIHPITSTSGAAVAPPPSVAVTPMENLEKPKPSVVESPRNVLTTELVGRSQELNHMQRQLQRALDEEPQLLFIRGESGIGKTALVDAFVRQAQGNDDISVVRYVCRSRLTAPLPCESLVSIVRSLCNQNPGALLPLLDRHAPSWRRLVQPQGNSNVLPENGIETAIPEIVEFLAAVAETKAILLLFEDLQWGDPYLLDFVIEFTHANIRSKIMIVATKQPAVAHGTKAPHLLKLRRDLEMHQHCESIDLERLTATAVRQFVSDRHQGPDSSTWGQALYELSEGHPWLMVATWRYWIESGKMSIGNILGPTLTGIAATVAPAVQRFLDSQLEALSAPDERVVIEAASVCHRSFSAATVAAALADDVVRIEEICERLARRQLLLSPMTGNHHPERRSASRYEFIHKIFQSSLLQRLPLARRSLYQRRLSALD